MAGDASSITGHLSQFLVSRIVNRSSLLSLYITPTLFASSLLHYDPCVEDASIQVVQLIRIVPQRKEWEHPTDQQPQQLFLID